MSDREFAKLHNSEEAYYDFCLQELKDLEMWGQADYIEKLREQLAEATAEIERLSRRLELDQRHSFDGIATRDETIRHLERENRELREEIDGFLQEGTG